MTIGNCTCTYVVLGSISTAASNYDERCCICEVILEKSCEAVKVYVLDAVRAQARCL